MPSENCFPFIQICEKFNSILLISFASFVVKTTVQEDLVKLPLHKAKSIVSTWIWLWSIPVFYIVWHTIKHFMYSIDFNLNIFQNSYVLV